MSERNERRHKLAALRELRRNLSISLGEASGKKRIEQSLESVILFIRATPELGEFELDAALYTLLLALRDLEQGTVASFLRPASEGLANRHPDPVSIKRLKAVAIFCVDGMVSAGAPIKDACEHVANALSRSNVAVKGKQSAPAWRTIRNWRADCQRRAGVTWEIVDALRKEAPWPPGMSPTHAKAVTSDKIAAASMAWAADEGL